MSKVCQNCGTTLPDNAEFCQECGQSQSMAQPQAPQQPSPPVNTMTNYPQPQQQYNNYSTPNYNQPPQSSYPQTVVYNNSMMEDNTHTSIGGWVGWLMLTSFLPIIGLIITLLCTKDRSVKNWVIAQFIISLIAIVLIAILCAVLGASVAGILSSASSYT